MSSEKSETVYTTKKAVSEHKREKEWGISKQNLLENNFSLNIFKEREVEAHTMPPRGG